MTRKEYQASILARVEANPDAFGLQTYKARVKRLNGGVFE